MNGSASTTIEVKITPKVASVSFSATTGGARRDHGENEQPERGAHHPERHRAGRSGP